MVSRLAPVNTSAMKINKIKRWLAPLRHTPLHPQWLIRDTLTAADLRPLQGLTLDIGCAAGQIRQQLPEDAQYIGLDYPDTAINWYQTRPDLFGDAQALPLANASVDSGLMLHVLEHLHRPQQALIEAARVLKPGGQLLVEVPFLYPLHDAPLDFHRWSRFGLQQDLELAGFEIIHSRAIGHASATAALLFNLAIGRLSLDWLQRRSPWLLVAPMLWLLIPLFNLTGRILAPRYDNEDFMPHRVRVLCRKPT